MSKIIQIKDQIQSGRWTDASGIIRYVDRGEVKFKDLIAEKVITKEFLSKPNFRIERKLIFSWVIKENIKIKTLEDVLPDELYAYISYEAIQDGLENGDLKFKTLIESRILSKDLIQEIGYNSVQILEWCLNEQISLSFLTEVLPVQQFEMLINNTLISKIDSNKVSFRALLEQKILDKTVFEKVKFDDEKISEWISKEGINPNELFDYIPSSQLQRIVSKFEELKKLNSIFEKIRFNQMNYDEIKSLVEKRVVTEKQLEQNCGLNEQKIAEILGRSVIAIPAPPLAKGDLEKSLLSGRTDVFTFGVVGSGKSLFLGALFAYSNSIGKRILEEAHQSAANYISFLSRVINNGLPVEGTDTNYAIHLPITFVNKKDHVESNWGMKKTKVKLHKLNFIEMSGEKFENLWDSDGFNWLKKYMVDSNNKKIFFFVVDYFRHRSNFEHSLNATQAERFEYLLTVLQQNGIIKSTISICMLITKWDLSPDQSDDAAREFVKANYLSLYNTINLIKITNPALDFVIHTFSIGEVTRINTYKFNPNNCEKIFDWLCNTSVYELLTPKS